MTVSIWLFLISVAVLIISALLLKQALRRSSDGGLYGIAEGASLSPGQDTLTLEIGDRIFNPEDWDIVTREMPRQFARRFRGERTVLALDWIRRVRIHVRRLVRDHRRAARVDSSVKVTDELKVAFEFLLFELTTGILCCLILVDGPFNTAKLLRWFLDSARELRRIAGEVVPDAGSAPIGIVKTNS